MSEKEKIMKINEVVNAYFEKNENVVRIRAKDLMPDFVKVGIWDKDTNDGLPIRRLLRKLDSENRLSEIPAVLPKRKLKNTYWFFRNIIQLIQKSIE